MADPAPAVAVVGIGAIGGLIAAELHAAGNRVTLCARRPLERLVVERDGDRRDLPVGRSADGEALGIATSPDEVVTTPWVVVALKAQDSAGAGPWLAELAGEETTVVVLQNGVEHRERLGPYSGDAPLIPGITDTAVERTAPGVLRHRAGD